ncbi:MAG: hypothetical protein ACXVFQ_18240 [Solirubrobacteraceae bacterium]
MSDDRRPDAESPHPIVRDQNDVLRLALAVAAQKGDPEPAMIQHTIGSREAATKTTGSWVRSDEPCYLIAMRGNFTARRPRRPYVLGGHSHDAVPETVSYSVQVLVVSVATGRIIDGGGGNEYPDLDSVGRIVTDRRNSPGGSDISGVR